MPLELMELRCGSSSTAFCTQYGSKDRHARLGGGVHAETIMGRLVHGTVWLKMGASTFASPHLRGTETRKYSAATREVHGSTARFSSFKAPHLRAKNAFQC